MLEGGNRMKREEAKIHRDAIIAFLNGAEIEMRQPDGTYWTPTDEPGWLPDWHYRVRQYVAVNVEELIAECVPQNSMPAMGIADDIRAYCAERGVK